MLYPKVNPKSLEPYYSEHVMAMTEEDLHSKADIAAQLAYRDKMIDRLTATVEWLQHAVSELQYNAQ